MRVLTVFLINLHLLWQPLSLMAQEGRKADEIARKIEAYLETNGYGFKCREIKKEETKIAPALAKAVMEANNNGGHAFGCGPYLKPVPENANLIGTRDGGRVVFVSRDGTLTQDFWNY